jgi:tetratricopeptide repeat protein
MSYMRGEPVQGRESIVRALDIAHSTGDAALVAPAESMFGHIEHATGNLQAAREHFERALERFREVGLHWGIGSALSGMGGVLLALGETSHAMRVLDEAKAALKPAGPWFLAPVRCYRAIAAVQRGNPDEAIGLMRESLTDIRTLKDKYAFVYALIPLAAAAAAKGDARWAARILGAHDAVAERTGVTVAIDLVSDLRVRAEKAVRGQLDQPQWTREHAAGARMSVETLLSEIDAHAVRPPVQPRKRFPGGRAVRTDS